jgi:hypothetical protein
VTQSSFVLKDDTQPGYRQGLRELHETYLQPLLQAVTATPPAKVLQPGETWSDKRPLPLDPGLGQSGFGQQEALELSLTYTYAGLRKRAGKEEGVITVTGTARAPREPENAEAQPPGRVSGTLVVDRASGQTVEADLTVRLDVNTSTAYGQTFTAQATQELKLRQQ